MVQPPVTKTPQQLLRELFDLGLFVPQTEVIPYQPLTKPTYQVPVMGMYSGVPYSTQFIPGVTDADHNGIPDPYNNAGNPVPANPWDVTNMAHPLWNDMAAYGGMAAIAGGAIEGGENRMRPDLVYEDVVGAQRDGTAVPEGTYAPFVGPWGDDLLYGTGDPTTPFEQRRTTGPRWGYPTTPSEMGILNKASTEFIRPETSGQVEGPIDDVRDFIADPIGTTKHVVKRTWSGSKTFATEIAPGLAKGAIGLTGVIPQAITDTTNAAFTGDIGYKLATGQIQPDDLGIWASMPMYRGWTDTFKFEAARGIQDERTKFFLDPKNTQDIKDAHDYGVQYTLDENNKLVLKILNATTPPDPTLALIKGNDAVFHLWDWRDKQPWYIEMGQDLSDDPTIALQLVGMLFGFGAGRTASLLERAGMTRGANIARVMQKVARIPNAIDDAPWNAAGSAVKTGAVWTGRTTRLNKVWKWVFGKSDSAEKRAAGNVAAEVSDAGQNIGGKGTRTDASGTTRTGDLPTDATIDDANIGRATDPTVDPDPIRVDPNPDVDTIRPKEAPAAPPTPVMPTPGIGTRLLDELTQGLPTRINDAGTDYVRERVGLRWAQELARDPDVWDRVATRIEQPLRDLQKLLSTISNGVDDQVERKLALDRFKTVFQRAMLDEGVDPAAARFAKDGHDGFWPELYDAIPAKGDDWADTFSREGMVEVLLHADAPTAVAGSGARWRNALRWMLYRGDVRLKALSPSDMAKIRKEVTTATSFRWFDKIKVNGLVIGGGGRSNRYWIAFLNQFSQDSAEKLSALADIIVQPVEHLGRPVNAGVGVRLTNQALRQIASNTYVLKDGTKIAGTDVLDLLANVSIRQKQDAFTLWQRIQLNRRLHAQYVMGEGVPPASAADDAARAADDAARAADDAAKATDSTVPPAPSPAAAEPPSSTAPTPPPPSAASDAGTRSQPANVRSFSVAKADQLPDAPTPRNDDFALGRPDGLQHVIVDGVSNSEEPRTWAELLADAVLSGRLTGDAAGDASVWSELADQYVETAPRTWTESARIKASFTTEQWRNYYRKSGASATLSTLTFDPATRTLSGFGMGDSGWFQIRRIGDHWELIDTSFPEGFEFTNTPAQISTRRAPTYSSLQRYSGSYEPGDLFIMATDTSAENFLFWNEKKAPIWDILANIKTPEEFQSFVDDIRPLINHDDDMTIHIIDAPTETLPTSIGDSAIPNARSQPPTPPRPALGQQVLDSEKVFRGQIRLAADGIVGLTSGILSMARAGSKQNAIYMAVRRRFFSEPAIESLVRAKLGEQVTFANGTPFQVDNVIVWAKQALDLIEAGDLTKLDGYQRESFAFVMTVHRQIMETLFEDAQKALKNTPAAGRAPGTAADDVAAAANAATPTPHPLRAEATAFVEAEGKASASSLQRKFKLGYAQAAELLDDLKTAGVVDDAGNAVKKAATNPPPPSAGVRPRIAKVFRKGINGVLGGKDVNAFFYNGPYRKWWNQAADAATIDEAVQRVEKEAETLWGPRASNKTKTNKQAWGNVLPPDQQAIVYRKTAGGRGWAKTDQMIEALREAWDNPGAAIDVSPDGIPYVNKNPVYPGEGEIERFTRELNAGQRTVAPSDYDELKAYNEGVPYVKPGRARAKAAAEDAKRAKAASDPAAGKGAAGDSGGPTPGDSPGTGTIPSRGPRPWSKRASGAGKVPINPLPRWSPRDLAGLVESGDLPAAQRAVLETPADATGAIRLLRQQSKTKATILINGKETPLSRIIPQIVKEGTERTAYDLWDQIVTLTGDIKLAERLTAESVYAAAIGTKKYTAKMAREQARETSRLIRIIDARLYTRLNNFIRNRVMYNIFTGPSAVTMDALTDEIAMAATGNPGAVAASAFLYPRHFKSAVLDAADDFDVVSGTIWEATGRRPRRYFSNAYDRALPGEVPRERTYLINQGWYKRTLGGVTESELIKRTRHYGDGIRRLALATDIYTEEVAKARGRIIDRIREAAIARKLKGDDIARRLERELPGAFSADDLYAKVKEITGDEGLATKFKKDWLSELYAAERKADLGQEKVLFSYAYTRADVVASKFFFMHYWQSRAMFLYAKMLATNYPMLAAWQSFWDNARERAQQEGYPPEFQSYVRYMANEHGLAGYFDAVGTLLPYDFWENMANENGNGEGWKKAVMSIFGLNPIIQGALALLGLDKVFGFDLVPGTPNIAGVRSVTQIATLVLNHHNAEADKGWNDGRVIPNIEEQFVRRMAEKGNDALNAIFPSLPDYEGFNPATADLVKLNSILVDQYIVQYGPVDTWDEPTRTAYNKSQAALTYGGEDAQADKARDTYWDERLKFAGIRWFVSGTRVRSMPYDQAKFDQSSQNPVTKERGYATRSLMTSTPEANVFNQDRDAYQAIGTPEQKKLADGYQQILGADFTTPTVTVAGVPWSKGQLQAMSEDERRELAWIWVRDQGGEQALSSYWDARKEFKATHESFQLYDEYWASRRAFKTDAEWRAALADANPAFATALQRQEDYLRNEAKVSPAELERRLQGWMGSEGYLAWQGTTSNLYDNPLPRPVMGSGLPKPPEPEQDPTAAETETPFTAMLDRIQAASYSYSDQIKNAKQVLKARGITPPDFETMSNPQERAYWQKILGVDFPEPPLLLRYYWRWAVQQRDLGKPYSKEAYAAYLTRDSPLPPIPTQ